MSGLPRSVDVHKSVSYSASCGGGQQTIPQTLMQNEVKGELTDLKSYVLKWLHLDKRCRNDDKWLIWRVTREFCPKFYIPFEDFASLPSFESITRCRRKIQNDEGLFSSSSEVVISREARKEGFKEWAKNDRGN